MFAGGGYVPLAPEGSRAANLCAFARTGPDEDIAIAVAPRLVAALLDDGRLPPERFSGTFVPVPGLKTGAVLQDAFTGKERTVTERGLAVDQLFSTLPVALLTTGRG